MVTQATGVAWLKAQNERYLDYDHQYGAQCFDFFNFYHQKITGDNPYHDGYALAGAWQIWYVATSRYIKIPNSPQLVPQPGDVLVYHNGTYGHVEVALNHTKAGLYCIGENEFGNPSQGVREVFRTWSQINSMRLIGAMRPRWAAPVLAPTPLKTATVVRQVYVRASANTGAPLTGTKVLNPGNTFRYAAKIAGQKVSQNGITTNLWYKTAYGHYVWTGNCRG